VRGEREGKGETAEVATEKRGSISSYSLSLHFRKMMFPTGEHSLSILQEYGVDSLYPSIATVSSSS